MGFERKETKRTTEIELIAKNKNDKKNIYIPNPIIYYRSTTTSILYHYYPTLWEQRIDSTQRDVHRVPVEQACDVRRARTWRQLGANRHRI